MSKCRKPDFLEYWTDAAGNTHILNVYCKCCGEQIQHGHMMKNHLGVTIPVLAPTPEYADMYIAFRDAKGTLRRKSTPMCIKCAREDFSANDLEELNEADTTVMAARHRESRVADDKVDEYLRNREGMKMVCTIGHCIPGYAIVGEGR